MTVVAHSPRPPPRPHNCKNIGRSTRLMQCSGARGTRVSVSALRATGDELASGTAGARDGTGLDHGTLPDPWPSTRGWSGPPPRPLPGPSPEGFNLTRIVEIVLHIVPYRPLSSQIPPDPLLIPSDLFSSPQIPSRSAEIPSDPPDPLRSSRPHRTPTKGGVHLHLVIPQHTPELHRVSFYRAC